MHKFKNYMHGFKLIKLPASRPRGMINFRLVDSPYT